MNYDVLQSCLTQLKVPNCQLGRVNFSWKCACLHARHMARVHETMEFIFFICFTFYFPYLLFYFFLLVINFIHISVYLSIPIAQFITPPSPRHRGFPPLVSIHLFYTSVSLFMPCKPVHLYHFSRFHIYALIYDICFSSFWLTSLCMTVFSSIHD